MAREIERVAGFPVVLNPDMPRDEVWFETVVDGKEWHRHVLRVPVPEPQEIEGEVERG